MKGYRHHAYSAVFAALMLLGAPGAAMAACTSPAGIAGGITWNGTDSVIWCDGTNWYALKSSGASGSAGYIQFSDGSGGFAHDSTANGKLFWDSTNHRLGIGTSVPSGDLSFAADANRTITMERALSGTNGRNLTISAGGAKSATADLNGGHLYLTSGTATGTGSSNIYFQTATPQATTNTTDNAPTTAMTILGNNNVGIGTATPAFKVHVLETSNAAETLPLHLQNAGTSNGTTVGISFTPASGSSTGAKITSNQVQNGNIALGFSTMGPTDGLANRMYISGPGNVGIGTTSPVALLNLGGNRSLASWTTAGANFHVNATTLTDTSGSGTIATRVVNSFNQPTLASSNAVTVTNAANVYIAGAPAAGTNTTITNSNALHVAAGNTYFGGNVGMGTTSPSAPLSFGAGIIAQKLNLFESALKRYGFGIQSGEMRTYMESDTNARLTWGTIDVADGTTWSEKMRLTASGNVGIGTSTPAAKLDVNGFMRLAKNGSAPATCDATIDGAIALTSARRMCVCDATSWKEVNSATACTW